MNQGAYSISQAAGFLGVPASTLRYWERQGLFCPDRNPDNSYREYSVYELIAAADVSFLRQLGLSVDEVRRYNGGRVEEMDAMLASAQDSVAERIRELEKMAARLEMQREACSRILALRDRPLERSCPDFPLLLAADYACAEHWRLGIDDPRRYGVVVEEDGLLVDGFAVRPGDSDLLEASDELEVLWREGSGREYWCGLLSVTMDGQSNDVERLFSQVRAQGAHPVRAIGRLLATALTEEGERADQYLAWVECR